MFSWIELILTIKLNVKKKNAKPEMNTYLNKNIY